MTKFALAFLLVSIQFATSPASAQEAGEIHSRMDRLELETAQLRAEIQQYRESIVRLPPVDPTTAVEPESQPVPAAPAAFETSNSPPSPVYPPRELPSELQKLSWSKGAFRFVPYGRIWFSMSCETQATQVGDYVLWVDSPSTRRGEESAVDARSTRLGGDITGPTLTAWGDAKTGGKIEFDFQGIALRKNEAGVLLRHAYAEAKNDDFRVLAGQTWDVISPLYTPTFDYTAGSAAGNLAYRRAQFRLERFLPCSEQLLVTLQTAASVDILVPQPANTRVFGSHAGWPDWQNRVALTFGDRKAKDAHPIEVGVSGHVGEENYDFLPVAGPALRDLARPTWSLNADAKVPLSKSFGVQGEVYTGTNLSNYFGGIMQGIDPVTLEPIRDSGGWIDVWYDMRPEMHWHVGYSIDDPLDQDLTVGRLYNQYLYANFVYDFSPSLNAGLEIASWKTLFVGLEPGNAVRLEGVIRYNF
jgi:hypothetical protein